MDIESGKRRGKGVTLYHVLGVLTACIWGTTFVSTKILINAGLSPTEIFICRFLIAYLCVIFVAHNKLWADSLKDEGLLILAGLTGGSLYFIAENSALRYTYATNVGLLIAFTPIFTIIFSSLILHVKMRRKMLLGSFIALCGVGFVVFNGTFNLHFSPLGDLLTILAAMLWAIYCVILKLLGSRYSTFFITRKVFFFGLLSAGIILLVRPIPFHLGLLSQPRVYGNLLFLGVVASMLCYVIWNRVVMVLGADKASNYIYINPLVTIITAILILGEPFTVYTAAGAALIIGGVYIAEKS